MMESVSAIGMTVISRRSRTGVAVATILEVVAPVAVALEIMARKAVGRRLVRAPIRMEIVLGHRVMARTSVGLVARLATGPGNAATDPSATRRPTWSRMTNPPSCWLTPKESLSQILVKHKQWWRSRDGRPLPRRCPKGASSW
jgi:hypothetical protein